MVNEQKLKKVFQFSIALLIVSANLKTHAQITMPDQKIWVDSVFTSLDLDQKIGQLIMLPAYAGGNEDHYEDLRKAIEDYQIGGIVFLNGHPTAQVKLTNLLQKEANIPLLIGMETTAGLSNNLDSTVNFPPLISLGAIENDTLIYNAGKEVGTQLRMLGVHFNIGPAVDIRIAGSGSNSFSDDPKVITDKAKYFIKGLQDGGIKVVINSFPGLGSTTLDPNLGLPVTKNTSQELREKHYPPFQQLANEEIGGVMTEFIYAPNILNDGLPIVFDKGFMNKTFKDEWEYEGLVFTGALNREGVVNNFRKGLAEEYSIKSGHDILLFPDNISATIRRVKRALKRDEITQEQLDNSVKKILNIKYQANLNKPVVMDTSYVYNNLNSIRTRKLQRELVLNSITLLRNEGNSIPYRIIDDKNFAILDLRNNPSGPLVSYLRKYTYFDYFSLLNDEFAEKLANYDEIFVAISDDIDPVQYTLLNELENITNIVVTVFGSPDILEPYNRFKNIVWVPENNEISQQLLPQLIFGAESFSGRFPININGFPRGTGITTDTLNRLAFTFPEEVDVDGDYLTRIDSIVHEAIETRATPGCQVLIARKGKVIWQKSYGYHSYDSIVPVDDITIYDLASITKVAASVQSLMFLYERGLIDLDKKVSHYLPELENTNKENMILRDILTHQAGLWPYLPFYKSTMISDQHSPEFYSYNPELGFINEVAPGLYSSQVTEDSVWQWVIKSKVREKKPNEPYDYKYSDMGYYIIHRLVENIINQPMEDFLNQNLYDPMGMTTTDYQPLCNFPLSCIAPTEMDDYFRFSLVAGTVHDQGAALIGGVAGHAGLFSNSLDLAKLMQLMLQNGSYGGVRYFQPETIELFTRQQYAINRRGLGWDKPVMDEAGGPTSDFASGKTFGHTGFTGTAAWVDPEFELVYIFLSNRVHPDATNTKLISTNVRTRIQDVIYKSMFRALQYEDIQ